MTGRLTVALIAVAGGLVLASTVTFSQQPGSTSTGASASAPQSPEWFLYRPDPAAAGRGGANAGGGGRGGRGAADAGGSSAGRTGADNYVVPGCAKSPICGPRPAVGGQRPFRQQVQWRTTMGWTVSYPFDTLPEGGGGVSAVAIDSKDNLWAFQRNAAGKPQLFKFDADHKLVLTVPEDVIMHQYKPHGIKVDKEDNVWITDQAAATVKKISPDGKLLMTIGTWKERGDWDESKGQRLLWEPVMIDFGANGDIFIFEGHANESPNDIDFSPTNMMGIARVIHLDKNGKFINQFYGNSTGPGKFYQTHGSAIEPGTGNIWIGDREEYRIVIYDQAGTFIRTLSMRNLVCALYFDPTGQLWMGTGQDGQIVKLNRDGIVIGAMGNGPGRGYGQFVESSYMTMDSKGNMYSGDTSVGRISKFTPPKK
jgi:hypothetical protein